MSLTTAYGGSIIISLLGQVLNVIPIYDRETGLKEFK